MKPPPLSLHPVVEWLVHGARNAPLSQEVLTELCQRLTAAGLPLWRVTVFVRTLHPEIVGRRFTWHPETGTEISDGSFELLERRSFLESPMMYVSKTGEALRRRLADPDCEMDYPVLLDLRADDVTDYFVAPLHFSNGEVHFSSWATRRPGGFTDADIEAIERVIPPLAHRRNPRLVSRRGESLDHLYRQECRRTRARRAYSPRRHRSHSRRDLAVRHARLHHARRHAAAAAIGRSAQPLFRLPGTGDSRTRRRSAQIYGRRAVGDLPDRRGSRFFGDLRRRARRRQNRARPYRRTACRRGRPGAAFRPGAACRRRAVRQYRQR